jgi:hypothetical protein
VIDDPTPVVNPGSTLWVVSGLADSGIGLSAFFMVGDIFPVNADYS